MLSCHRRPQAGKGIEDGLEHGSYYVVERGCIGIMENKMETTILYRDYIGLILGCWKIKWKLLFRV